MSPRTAPMTAPARVLHPWRALPAVGLLAALLLVPGLLPVGGGSARAASFQVSPTRFEFSLARRFTNYFSVTNNSGAPLRIRVTTAFLDLDADGHLVPRTGQPHDLAPWLVLNPRRISLAPSQRRVVRFTVRPPAELPPGEYRTVVFFEELPPRPQEGEEGASGMRVQILTRLGITIYGRSGEAMPDPRLESPQVVAGADAVQLSGVLHNTGLAHLTLTLAATLLNGAGDAQGRAEQRVTVQRDQRRPVKVTLPRPAPGGYRLRVEGRSEDKTWFTVELPVTVEPASQ